MKWICGLKQYNGFLIINCNKPVISRMADANVMISIVSNVHGVAAKTILGEKYKKGITRGVRKVTDARHMAMWFVRAKTKLTLSEVGRVFNKDHSSVIYAEKNVQKLMTDNKFREKFMECDQLVREYFYQ